MISATLVSVQYVFPAGGAPASFPIGPTVQYEQASEIYAALSQPSGPDIALTPGVDFSVTAPSGGPVTNGTLTRLTTWNASATRLTIYRQTQPVNATSVVDGGVIDAAITEYMIDELTQMVQELSANTKRGLYFPITDVNPNGLLPAAATRALQFLGFDASGNPIAAGLASAPVSAAMQPVVAAASLAAALALLGVVVVNQATGASNAAYNLPAAAGSGTRYFITKSDAAAGWLQVTPNGTDTVNGWNRAYNLTQQGASVTLEDVDVGVWSVIATSAGDGLQALAQLGSSATPFTLSASDNRREFAITTGASAFVFNLPALSTVLGNIYKISKVDSGAGAVQVAPNGTDAIGTAGNVSAYLGAQFQQLELFASSTGWIVLAGQLMPAQGVDTNGSQYFLGKLRHPPLGGAVGRQLYSAAPPAVSAWSSAQQASGNIGVPVGAKAIRVKLIVVSYSTAGGVVHMAIYLSDNNSNVPSESTAHPEAEVYFIATAAAQLGQSVVEVDVPLNSAGQFYLYTGVATNTTIGFSTVNVYAVGYYMGDWRGSPEDRPVTRASRRLESGEVGPHARGGPRGRPRRIRAACPKTSPSLRSCPGRESIRQGRGRLGGCTP